MIDLSLCMVTYQARAVLEECLESIYRVDQGVSFELVLVDNGSTDGTTEMVRDRYPQVQYIRNEGNAGFQRATNQGLRAAEGRYLMWLNNDTVVSPGAFAALVTFADAHPESGIVGPKVVNRDGSLQKQCRRGDPTPWSVLSYFAGLARLFPKSRFFAGYLVGWSGEDEVVEVDACSGAAMMLRREAMDAVGPIDETFFYGGEDLDYCYQVRQKGYTNYYHPEAQIMHYGGAGGSKNRPYKLTYEFHRSMVLYFRKNLTGRYPFFLVWLIYAGIWGHFAFAMARNLIRKDKIPGGKKP